VSQAFGVFTAADDTNRHYKVELVAEQCSGKVVIALCQSDGRVLAGCAKPYDVAMQFNVYKCSEDDYSPETSYYGSLYITSQTAMVRSCYHIQL
jgi:hypothetical protein